VLADLLGRQDAIAIIELVGALLIVGCCVAAVVALVRTRSPEAARLLIIQGSLWCLSLKTAGSLLKTIELQTWAQIGAFAAILALRTLIKRVMTWEGRRITAVHWR
jgi:Protein of unknown function (DUF1622)